MTAFSYCYKSHYKLISRKIQQCQSSAGSRAKDAAGTAAFYVCLSSVRTREGSLRNLKQPARAYTAATRESTDQLWILCRLFCIVFYQDCHAAFQTCTGWFKNMIPHTCFYKSCLGFFFFSFSKSSYERWQKALQYVVHSWEVWIESFLHSILQWVWEHGE